jgi:hypothetical protein
LDVPEEKRVAEVGSQASAVSNLARLSRITGAAPGWRFRPALALYEYDDGHALVKVKNIVLGLFKNPMCNGFTNGISKQRGAIPSERILCPATA